MTWTVLSFPYGSTLSSTQMTQLYDNFAALANKDSGAPQLATGYVTQTMIASSAVGQSQLKASSGSVTGFGLNTLPGGNYGFWPTIRGNTTSSDQYEASLVASVNVTAAVISQVTTTLGTSYVNRIYLAGDSGTVYATQYYIQASPPYDLGDGEIGQFIFAVIDNATGEILQTYSAPEAPWHNNGPTDTRADYYDKNGRGWRNKVIKEVNYVTDAETGLLIPEARIVGYEQIEITQTIKQADMPLIPHPFTGNDLTGKTVVMLDPVSSLTWHLAEMHEEGMAPGELLHEGYIRIDNIALNRAGPPGVMVVPLKWRNTQ